MNYQKLTNLSNLQVLTKETLRTYEENTGRLDFNIKYWLKKGKIIPVKKGMYILGERWEREADKDLYREYIANKLYEPSYLSAEYVMNKNSLLTESVTSVTAITTRKTKTFTNALGTFVYYSISPGLFSGFYIKPFYSSAIFAASRAKATFDYLYLRFIRNAVISKQIVSELRINWENLPRTEFLQFKNWIKISKSQKMKQVYEIIYTMYYA